MAEKVGIRWQGKDISDLSRNEAEEAVYYMKGEWGRVQRENTNIRPGNHRASRRVYSEARKTQIAAMNALQNHIRYLDDCAAKHPFRLTGVRAVDMGSVRREEG